MEGYSTDKMNFINMCIASFTVKAGKSTVSLDYQAFDCLSTYETAYVDDISGKIAADVRFKEPVDLEISVAKKNRSLSSSDKKLLLTSFNEKNTSTLLIY